MIKSRLSLQQLVLSVHLGVPLEERRDLQKIYVNIEIDYLGIPKACKQDVLNDIVCYDQLAKTLQQVCNVKTYRLIESLSYVLFEETKKCLTTSAKISLTVTKNPPMDNLQQASFTVTEIR